MATATVLWCGLFVLVLAHVYAADNAKPNVLFVLTDDQDIMLGSMNETGPMQKTRSLIIDKGVYFSNGFANTPICCPSRAEIQTGRFMHNTKVYGNDCGGIEFVQGPEKLNVAFYAKGLGYTTFYAGKYLNNYGNPSVGGLARIPGGWDQWYGLQGNSKYYNYQVSNNGVTENHGDDYATDYFTDRIANRTLEFLANATKNGTPFFAMVGTPASHGPNTPAPQYSETYAGKTSPRLPSWNKAPQPDKHWLLRQIVPMDQTHINVSDVFFQRRWAVLRSVDDMVERFYDFLTEAGVWDNTFFIYTGDHGYHLGEFGMLYDKRMLYETDIRVPLFAKGPGIPAGSVVDHACVHIDLTPTILDMMGMPTTPDQMDGRSWLPLAQQKHQQGVATSPSSWRGQFMVEYSGGGQPELNLLTDGKATCSAMANDSLSIQGGCSCTVGATGGVVHDQSPCDGRNNTYACIRTITPSENSIYCEFNDTEAFVEYYDLSVDPYNLKNLYLSTNHTTLMKLSAALATAKSCSGSDCRTLREYPTDVEPLASEQFYW